MSEDGREAAAPAGLSVNFLFLVAITAMAGAGLATGDLRPGWGVFVFVLAGWILSVCAHEWGHAAAALQGGDHTIADKGYLSLDPARFAHPLMSIILPIAFLAMGGIGFPGGAVYIRQDLLRGALWRAGVALAGPAMTGVMCLFWALPFMLGLHQGAGGEALWAALGLLVFLQATALLLNLLPVPGLDGFAAIAAFLPQQALRAIAPVSSIAIIVFLVVIFTVPGALSPLFGVAFAITEALGVERALVLRALDLFRFWET